ncbi:LOW QUALITY PROTEIN: mucin-19-like [Boleophthalmus pectinirostris]|uniref:LOW QUALITY PROTEIN: mucin-19-like n=1 Tax=Boleophthalmus pectinirostris TaxID=150288 RepID=UPI0024322A5B|nr:LOW QUALITY PROTEIN: mucin-19-like [Boleophthalmus pectinirostris]
MCCSWVLALSFLITLALESDGLTPGESKTYTCKTFGSGVVQPFNGTLFHVRSNCPFTLTSFTHNRVDSTITTRRGVNGLLEQVEITVNKVTTILQNGSVQVEGKSVRLPYDHTYQHIFPFGIYTKLRSSVIPLSVVWQNVPGGIGKLWVEVEQELDSDMEGLCGNHLRRITAGNIKELISQSVLREGTCKIWDPASTMNKDCRKFLSQTVDCLTQMTPDYIKLCEQNIYNSEQNEYVRCSFFQEVIQQCGEHSHIAEQWRDITHCSEPKCPGELLYEEKGAAFIPSCSNPKIDSQEVTSSCVCPNDLVLDDHQEGFHCVNTYSCSCVFGNSRYEPGEIRSNTRETCLCSDGEWKCTSHDLPSVCVIEGNFVTTFDGKRYTVGSGCAFVASQGSDWKIVIEYAVKATSMNSVDLDIFEEKYKFANNKVTFDGKEISDLHESEHALVFWQSSMFVEVYTAFGLKLQIQMSPEIHLYISPPQTTSDTISGLCGNNNGDTTDDFRTNTRIIENSPHLFAQSWSVSPCNKLNPPPPCIRTEYEIFAEKKCSVLNDPTGIFAACHGDVPTDNYFMACVERTCTCGSDLHQCLCSALSSYVKACSALGVEVGDWRKATNCSVECPGNQEFSYNVVACNSTCRSLSGPDLCCLLEDAPVEGCGCPEGTHLNKDLICSPKSQCECHYNGGSTPPGPAVIDGRQCFCEDGELKCSDDCGCTNGKVCVHCSDFKVNTLQKTCGSLSKPTTSSCESGCYCPVDQFENHHGDCVPLDNCTCSYSGKVYNAGETVKSSCTSCVCSNGQWQCTDEPCSSTCQVFGNGHYQTFDSKWFRFDGHCQYTLVKDDCGRRNGTFSVRVESVPCCDEALTCSRSIVLDVKDHFSLSLSDMKVTEQVHSALHQHSPPYTIQTVGLYIIITVPTKGITLIWDKHTWITIELQPQWRKEVCGLCGNFDSNEMNDLQIKDSSVALTPVVFGNSWKSPSPPCSDVTTEIFPCERNSYCGAWAQRRCRIITGDTFKDCHLKVDPEPYYQACVQESCSCEFEGRFLGFCTAVAAYAEACSHWDVCVDWRTPDLCPVYCDYYNEHDQCVWHYQACGQLLTCGQDEDFTYKLEGCYPRCPEEKPYYDEHTGKCTDLESCTCYFNGTVLDPGTRVLIDLRECNCQNGKIKCTPSSTTALPTTTTTATTTITAPTTISTTTSTSTAPTTTSTTTTTVPPTASPTTTAPTTTSTTTTIKPPTTSTTTTTTTATPATTVPPSTLITTTTVSPTTSTTTATTTASSTITVSPKIFTSTTTTTTIPPTTSSSTTVPTTTSTTTRPCECVNLKTKQKWACGETWIEDCDYVTCTNSVLQLTPVTCPEYSPPNCPRGLIVNVSDGCCERPMCDCRCELYGDPHYISFGGVDPEPYYQACVQESCSCEFEGRFLGFCTAVAAYAEACSHWDVCVDWRTPDLCPVYCDYYNEHDQCVWHYQACGQLLTCGQDEDFTYKLEGRCELYGDPHYISFGGVTFDFLDDCTYVLVEEQFPQYNLTIAVDNYFCIEGLDGSCVKGVIVKYKGKTATLSIDSYVVQASLNSEFIEVPFEEPGFRFESTGYVTTLVLPEIRSYVSLTPSFSLVISLAMENFGYNTQGQCGVCGGESCIRPGGYIEEDSCCDKTAYDWIYEDPQKPKCVSAPRDIPCGAPTPTPPCSHSHPLCELLNEQ